MSCRDARPPLRRLSRAVAYNHAAVIAGHHAPPRASVVSYHRCSPPRALLGPAPLHGALPGPEPLLRTVDDPDSLPPDAPSFTVTTVAELVCERHGLDCGCDG